MEVRLLPPHNHLVWLELLPTCILGVVAENLAKSLDKGLTVEYRAPVLIVSHA